VKAFQDPDAQAIVSDQDFNDSMTNITNWLDEECNLGS
jgi:hypothetical protein